MNEVNISIAGRTSEELIQELERVAKGNLKMCQILERNQIRFICSFFSEFLTEDGRYIKNARFKDLMIIYYADFYIKNKIGIHTLKIERYLNTVILDLYERKKIAQRTSDKENSFGKLKHFFSKKLSEEERELVISKYNKIYDTCFTISNFKKKLAKIVDLRNFILHHYPIVSYEYASVIKNGTRHIEKDGKATSLAETMATLCDFINKRLASKLVVNIKKVLNEHKFSTKKIFDHVFEKYRKVLNFQALEEVSRENLHYSIIDLIKS